MDGKNFNKYILYIKLIGLAAAGVVLTSVVLLALLSWQIAYTENKIGDLEASISEIDDQSSESSNVTIPSNATESSNVQGTTSMFCLDNKNVNNIVDGAVLNFIDADINIGGHFDLISDRYIAPCNGAYMFTLDVQTYDNTYSGVLRIDGDDFLEKYLIETGQIYSSGALIVILNLDKDQQVDVWTTTTSGIRYAIVRFTGQLLMCTS